MPQCFSFVCRPDFCFSMTLKPLSTESTKLCFVCGSVKHVFMPLFVRFFFKCRAFKTVSKLFLAGIWFSSGWCWAALPTASRRDSPKPGFTAVIRIWIISALYKAGVLHDGAVISTVASRQEGSWFQSWLGPVLCRFWLFSMCMHGFCADTPASSQKSHIRWIVKFLKSPLWVSVSIRLCLGPVMNRQPVQGVPCLTLDGTGG